MPQLTLRDFLFQSSKNDQATTHTILHGDIYAGLLALEEDSIACVITSPPYYNQRDYGFDDQIGNEPTQDDYIARLIKIFNLLKTRLQPEGIFYLNIGDKYISKYGNTPLGMIPYKVAYWMTKSGWRLEDILIWYKPNHMPSSVQNRFTNTYEPVFVFSKTQENYYTPFKASPSYSNILKIPLQQVPYAHMATFPEKLVETLITNLALPPSSLIVDPFAGSGTTTKAVQTLNRRLKKQYSTLLIEAQPKYIQIIQKRCQIPSQAIIQIPFQPYTYQDINLSKPPCSTTTVDHHPLTFDISSPTLLVKILEPTDDWKPFLAALANGTLAEHLADDGVCFLGLPTNDIEPIFELTQVPHWIIRNMLVIFDRTRKTWYPVFFLVKDIKTVRYQFKIDAIRTRSRVEDRKHWNDLDFIGYKVVQSGAFFKQAKHGVIAKVLSRRSDGLPKWVIVQWTDRTASIEEVINPPLPEKRVTFVCPRCSEQLAQYYHSRQTVRCENCKTPLWESLESIPKLELNAKVPPEYDLSGFNATIEPKETKRDYQGKFKDVARINRGQSPGARASVSELYFSVQRYYDVSQGLICDYLNLHRQKKHLSKKALTDLFPPSYKHTVGHWLRKDMGGSLPKVEDMQTLAQILDLDKTYVDYVTRMGLKLQTVTAHIKGKNPGDYFEKTRPELLKMLKKLIS